MKYFCGCTDPFITAQCVRVSRNFKELPSQFFRVNFVNTTLLFSATQQFGKTLLNVITLKNLALSITLCTVCKNEKFTVTQKNISSSLLLSIFFIKTPLSGNFSQRSVTVKFLNLHTVLWKSRKFTPLTLFWQNIRESNAFTKSQ